MNVNDYQRKALKTAKYYSEDDQFMAGVLGAAAEAGELAGKVEKRIRKGKVGMPPIPSKEAFEMVKEIGDTIWFLTCTLDALGYSLEGCLQTNLNKLEDRDKRGVIHGNGDNR